jgi:hypothetical protein
LAETGAVQRRLRVLSARVTVYLLLAGCLFAELGYRQVRSASSNLPACRPRSSWQLRRRHTAGPDSRHRRGLLVRVKSGRGGPKLPELQRHRDGSYRSVLGGVAVRVIDAESTIATKTGRRTGTYRLTTTLLDPDRYPAFEPSSARRECHQVPGNGTGRAKARTPLREFR